jgi:uncharacterized protein
MPILIDGYNLLYVAGIVAENLTGVRPGAGELERSRVALLNFLAESLSEKDSKNTTVVFDAKNSPPGLPKSLTYRGINVRFAANYPNADELIAEMVDQCSSPRHLTVVSSDHEVQRSARRRKALAVDADRWYREVIQSHQDQQIRDQNDAAQRKPITPLPREDVEYWINQFGGESAIQDLLKTSGINASGKNTGSDKTGADHDQTGAGQHRPERGDPIPNDDSDDLEIFPPGFFGY